MVSTYEPLALLPEFGAETRRVGAYAPGGYEAYFRVLLLLKCDRPDGRYQVEMPWRELFSLAGVPLTTTSQLREIPRELREQWGIMRTGGWIERETARALSSALARATTTPDIAPRRR